MPTGEAQRESSEPVPWLSVLMPTYQGARYLRAALESVASEGTPGVEVIAADDGSTDGTRELLSAFATSLPLHVIDGARVGNWVASTNACLRKARGKYVALLHQDDVWLPGRLTVLRRLLATAPGAALALTAASFIDHQGMVLGRWEPPFDEGLVDPALLCRALLVQNSIALPAPVFLRSAAVESGGLDEALWYTADWDLWLRLAALGPVPLAAESTVGFRVHRASQTVARPRSRAEFRQQLERVLERHLPAWLAGAGPHVEGAARLSIEVNVALSSAHQRQGWSLGGVALALGRAGPLGVRGYLRDSRLQQRVLARLRAGLRR